MQEDDDSCEGSFQTLVHEGKLAGASDRLSLQTQHQAEIEALRAESSSEDASLSSLSTSVLFAFLRASQFSMDEARKRLLRTAAWRRDTQISSLMANDEWRTAERATRPILLYDYFGPDQHGRPFLIERVGAWDVPRILEASDDLQRFKLLHSMAAETLQTFPRPDNADPRGYSLVMDMAGLSVRHLRPRLATVFGQLNEIDERHYPDSVAHIFVVNAPGLMRVLFGMIRHFLNEDTATKVHCSSGVPPELAAQLGETCLPKELGGTIEGAFPYSLSSEPSSHPQASVVTQDGPWH